MFLKFDMQNKILYIYPFLSYAFIAQGTGRMAQGINNLKFEISNLKLKP
jgi:hypothetical protein